MKRVCLETSDSSHIAHLSSTGIKKKLALLQLAKHREPMLLISGQAVSAFADGIAFVALTLLVLDTTHHSVSKLAWFAAARMFPTVAFLLIGGAIVDRFSRRLLLLISDSTRAILTGALVVLIGLGQLRFWELMMFAVLFGTFDALFMPATTSITPEIVPEDLLPAKNAVRPLSQNLIGEMIGPAVGGVIARFSTSWALGIDCTTFFVSAGALALMKPTAKPTNNDDASMWSDIKEGLHYTVKTRCLWTTLVAVAGVNAFVFTPMFVLIPFFLLHDLHTSRYIVGYSFAMSGIAGA